MTSGPASPLADEEVDGGADLLIPGTWASATPRRGGGLVAAATEVAAGVTGAERASTTRAGCSSSPPYATRPAAAGPSAAT